MTGKMYNETLGRICCGLVFIGFNATFFPQFVMGSQGMPRRYFDYPNQLLRFHPYHFMSSIGAFLTGLAFLIMLVYLVYSVFKGARAWANPWASSTIEWQTSSPPPTENFITLPAVGDPYDFSKINLDEIQVG